MSGGAESLAIYKIGGWVISLLVAGLATIGWYDKRNKDKDIKDLQSKSEAHGNKITEHETKFVTDAKVRLIVKDELVPLKDSVARMETCMLTLVEKVSDLAAEVKAMNAVYEYIKQHDKDKK